MIRSTLLATALAALTVTFAAAEDNWPQFRGAESLGTTASDRLPERWSATENVRWKTDLPGRGWSSPIVWDRRVFITTVVNEGETEEPKKGLYFGGNRPDIPQSVHRWLVYCLDLDSGEVVWERLAHEGRPASSLHVKNTYASETPVTDGERMYAYFGNLGVFCYDFDGQLLWAHETGAHAMRYGWGTAASPVLHEDRLYIVNDNDDESYLMALDKRTGDVVMKVDRDEKSNWATPYVWQNELRTELVTPGTGKIRSYDLEGNVLWELGGMSSITIPTPFAQFGLLYVTSGYVRDEQKPLYAIRPGAAGDITLPEKGDTQATDADKAASDGPQVDDDLVTSEYIAWCRTGAGPYNPSPVLYGEQIFVLLDRGFMASYDARTGAEVYGRQRIPDGRQFTSSPWVCRGRIFCLNEDGVTFVIKAGREFEVLHTNPLAEDDMCMATPALAGDQLIIRTAARVYCIEQGAAREAEAGS